MRLEADRNSSVVSLWGSLSWTKVLNKWNCWMKDIRIHPHGCLNHILCVLLMLSCFTLDQKCWTEGLTGFHPSILGASLTKMGLDHLWSINVLLAVVLSIYYTLLLLKAFYSLKAELNLYFVPSVHQQSSWQEFHSGTFTALTFCLFQHVYPLLLLLLSDKQRVKFRCKQYPIATAQQTCESSEAAGKVLSRWR